MPGSLYSLSEHDNHALRFSYCYSFDERDRYALSRTGALACEISGIQPGGTEAAAMIAGYPD